MNEAREIFISTTIGLGILLSTLSISEKLTKQSLQKTWGEPVAVTGLEPSEKKKPLKTFWPKPHRPVLVAVIDTGCDIYHPALQSAIWKNPGETGKDSNGKDKSSNGIDDDANGWVDDVHGWDFVSNSPALMDEHGHGTHVAGIIAATDGGSSPHVSLMILKYYDTESDGEETLERSIAALEYALAMGAEIINYSGGGALRNPREEELLAIAQQRGVIVVAAAGNEGQNSDFFPFYPADYDLPNIVSVAATDNDGQLLKVSNYGRSTVDVAAPGKNILSTLPRSSYGYMTGTSQASATVTRRLAELILEVSPQAFASAQELLNQLSQRGRKMASLNEKVSTQVFVGPEMGQEKILAKKRRALN